MFRHPLASKPWFGRKDVSLALIEVFEVWTAMAESKNIG